MNNLPLIDPTLDAHTTLAACSDFVNEVGILQEMLEKRGHILIVCVKCHPEIAGVGVEYSWGKSKMYYRRHNSPDQRKNTLLDRIMKSVSTDVLPLDRIWKFERRTRTYRNIYTIIQEKKEKGELELDDMTHELIEKMMKKYRTHRNIVEIEREYLQDDNF